MSAPTYSATLYPNTNPDGLSIEELTGGARSTPGNVGVCLCGGGSRALSAGMGQLRALAQIKSVSGVSLLAQVKAISTVSGGSWLGISFNFQSSASDSDFLNLALPEPQDLTAEALESLPEDCIGARVVSEFSVPWIALEALFYHLFSGTPADMLWQTVIGKHILKPYGLYDAGKRQAPTRTFSYDAASTEAILALPGQDCSLTAADFFTLASAAHPYSICNTAMFVTGAEPPLGDYRYLAPVQCTPFFTGIVGTPGGTDANGRSPGGGGVTSFGFNSELAAVDSDHVDIDAQRWWSIMDCVGASSAAFAETLANLFSDWREQPQQLLDALHEHGHAVLSRVKSELERDEHAAAQLWLEAVKAIEGDADDVDTLFEKLAVHEVEAGKLHKVLDALGIDGLVPRYRYWPVADAAPATIQPTQFADGGNLENTGLASMLSYRDIDSVIACVNSTTLLAPQAASPASPPVLLDETSMVITTSIEVDAQIPPLFGYQPMANGQYTPYCLDGKWNVDPDTAWGAHNAVFEQRAFTDCLTGLWTAAAGSERAAVYLQTLAVRANPWFGVPARDSVKVLWVYTSTARDWENALSTAAKKALKAIDKFPNYDTLDTELSPAEVNLLSSLATWAMKQNEATLLSLFED